MNLSQIKSVFFKVLIGCLVAAGALAVITVLIGSFNDVCQRALVTIVMVALHALFAISFIYTHEKQDTSEDLMFFTNATFCIIVISFITSILATWSILPGAFVARLYALYFVLLFAVLHGEVLAKTRGEQPSIDAVTAVNFFFMIAVVLLLLPVIFVTGVGLGDFYYRLLAACGIVDATLTLIAVLMHHLYIQKHPKVKDQLFTLQQLPTVPGQPPQAVQVAVPEAPKRRMNIVVLILLVYAGLQIGGSILVFAFMALSHS